MSKNVTKDSQESHLSIESKIRHLDEMVEWFYGEDFSLDQAINHYEKSIQLASEIKQDLTQLKNQVEVIADFTKA